MASYKSFAIVGVGSLGTFVVDELLKGQVAVKILTRDASKPELQTFKERGATLAQVDYTKAAEVKAAFTGPALIARLFSLITVSEMEKGVQLDLIPYAKAAGVKLFVPAEHGLYIDVGSKAKTEARSALKAIGLPYTLFVSGYFADLIHWFLFYNYAEGNVRIVGEVKTAFSTTSRADVARFIAHMLTTSSPGDLEWAELFIEGDRKSPLEIKAIAEKKLNKPFTVNFVGYEENAVSAGSDMVAFLSKAVEDGLATAGTSEQVKQTIAKFYPDWNPSPVDAFIIE